MSIFSRKQPDDLPRLSEVKKLKVEPGDIVILRYPGKLNEEQRQLLVDHVGPNGVVLEEGGDVSVLAFEDVWPTTAPHRSPSTDALTYTRDGGYNGPTE